MSAISSALTSRLTLDKESMRCSCSTKNTRGWPHNYNVVVKSKPVGRGVLTSRRAEVICVMQGHFAAMYASTSRSGLQPLRLATVFRLGNWSVSRSSPAPPELRVPPSGLQGRNARPSA